jgi:hypothetical protein
MTRTLPWRRITLHFSQIVLTLGRTFMWTSRCPGRAGALMGERVVLVTGSQRGEPDRYL